MTSKTNYRVIGFGKTENGFFNEPAFCSTIGYACGIYDAHLQDPEMDGAVIIRCNHEDWEVIQEFNSKSYSISIECSPLGVLRVNKSPELVMV
jgi:hypothetical protein